MLRTVCEYGVIMHHKELKLQEVYEFMRGEVGKRYISSVLIKYFELISLGKHASYRNPREQFDYLFGSQVFRYKDGNER